MEGGVNEQSLRELLSNKEDNPSLDQTLYRADSEVHVGSILLGGEAIGNNSTTRLCRSYRSKIPLLQNPVASSCMQGDCVQSLGSAALVSPCSLAHQKAKVSDSNNYYRHEALQLARRLISLTR